MSKNLRCPVCQKGTVMFKDNLSCECSRCKFQCHHGQIERIDAAMELARAAVWSVECEGQRDYMDDTTSNTDAWRSIVNLDLEANDEACRAFERCEEVFGV